MSTFYTTFPSKSDFSFVLLLVTFEPLEVDQSYIPFLKDLMFGINVVGAQGCSCISTFCHAPLKIALLLNKMANGPYSFSETVNPAGGGSQFTFTVQGGWVVQNLKNL